MGDQGYPQQPQYEGEGGQSSQGGVDRSQMQE